MCPRAFSSASFSIRRNDEPIVLVKKFIQLLPLIEKALRPCVVEFQLEVWDQLLVRHQTSVLDVKMHGHSMRVKLAAYDLAIHLESNSHLPDDAEKFVDILLVLLVFEIELGKVFQADVCPAAERHDFFSTVACPPEL